MKAHPLYATCGRRVDGKCIRIPHAGAEPRRRPGFFPEYFDKAAKGVYGIANALAALSRYSAYNRWCYAQSRTTSASDHGRQIRRRETDAICSSALGRDCTDLACGEQTWEYLKKRLKELNLAGPDGPCYRTKCQCLAHLHGRPHRGGLSRGNVVSERDTSERRADYPGTSHWRADRGRTLLCEKFCVSAANPSRGKAMDTSL